MPQPEADPHRAEPRSRFGVAGERAAARWYAGRGFTVVARNWRCAMGELDLVVRRGGTLVFVEVKTRTGTAFGGPYEAVGWRKQRKLRALGEAFVTSHPDAARASSFRFDVASILLDGQREPDVHVFEDAF